VSLWGDKRLESGEWQFVSRVRNPWGIIPLTAGGQSLTERAKSYMEDVVLRAQGPDVKSRHHHYVPKSYMKAWSENARRVSILDTTTGIVRLDLGMRSVCMEEDFYRVQGPDGKRHNRVEEVMAVFDAELLRVLNVFRGLQPGADVAFDDFMSLGLMMMLQRTRNVQTRRLMGAMADFWEQQTLTQQRRKELEGAVFALKAKSEFHVDMMSQAMWTGADNMTTRQLEIWDDPHGRFVTSDCPVQTPRGGYVTPDLLTTPRIWWPIGPTRAICLARDTIGEKVVFRRATRTQTDEVRTAMVRGRERFIIATRDQLSELPQGKMLRKRTQVHMRCEPWQHPGQCRVAYRECYAPGPDIQVCEKHYPLRRPELHA